MPVFCAAHLGSVLLPAGQIAHDAARDNCAASHNQIYSGCTF